MGLLDRFEQRLDRMVNGAFARAFKAEVQPVEIAAALQREMDDRAAVVSRGRTVVPNVFNVELSPHDHERLSVYSSTLTEELAGMVREYAEEQRYTFVGGIEVVLGRDDTLETGLFRVLSEARAGVASTPQGGVRVPAAAPEGTGQPRLVVDGTAHPLTRAVTRIGRGTDVDLRVAHRVGSLLDRSGSVFVVGGGGDPHTQVLGQHRADRLDSPTQTAGLPAVCVAADELRDQWDGRSSSAAKKADAALRIALTRLSSAFSRRNLRTSADSSDDTPERLPASTSACRTHLRTVSGVPTPSSSATRPIAAHSDSYSELISATIRTARCFSSSGYRLDESPGMTPNLPSSGVSGHAGGIQHSPTTLHERP